MKLFFLSTFVIFISVVSFAQGPYLIQKGNFLGGGKGKLSFSSQEYLDEKYKETHIMLRPSFGYFLMDGWAVGINLDMESTKIKLGSDEIGNSNDLGAGLWTHYYFLPAIKKINFFGEAGFNMGGYKEDDDDRIGYNCYNFGLSMACFLNKHVALEIGVEYSSKKYEDEDSRVNRVGLCAGFQIHFSTLGSKRK
jgi:hypothetical protein